MKSYLTFHEQDPVDGHIDAILRAKPRAVKLFHPEQIQELHNAGLRNCAYVFRPYIDHQQPYLDLAGQSRSDADRAADNYINTWIDSYIHHVISLDLNPSYLWLEPLNETYPTGNPETQRKAIAFDRAFVRRLLARFPGLRPIVYTAASGNIDHDEWPILLDLARETAAAGGAFGYHAYWSVVDKQSFLTPPVGKHHDRDYQLRWDVLDLNLYAAGVRGLNWFLGETGAIGAHGTGDKLGYWQNPDDGWRHPHVYNANLDLYAADWPVFDRQLHATLAAREGRLLGAALFTTGRFGWDHFQIRDLAMHRLADYIRASGDAPAPTPAPAPETTNLQPMTIAPNLTNLNVRNAPRVAADTLVGCLQAGAKLLIIPTGRYTAGDDIWIQWGNLYIAQRYDGRTYLVPKG